ncbi:MAG: hypothetical protein WAV78_02010, partial [Xanthobacteraceae bacterium]
MPGIAALEVFLFFYAPAFPVGEHSTEPIGKPHPQIVMHPLISGRLREAPVWVNDEFVCDARVEGFIALRRLLEIDNLLKGTDTRSPVSRY